MKWPTLTRDQNGRLTSAAYSGNFELVADATWKFIDILPDKSQLTSEAQGEYPSMTQLNKLTAVHPGVGVEASGLSAYVNNCDCVYLVETVRNKFRVVGSETLNVEATDECPAPFYQGKIDTEDGIIYADQQQAQPVVDGDPDDDTADP